MQEFQDYVKEQEKTVEAIADEAKESSEKTTEKLQSMFPEFNVRAKYNKNMGGSITVAFAGPNPANKIPENSPTFMRFMMHLSDSMARPKIPEVFEIEKLQGPREIKFRKIKGKSIEEALTKLERWFEKNKDKIMELEGLSD